MRTKICEDCVINQNRSGIVKKVYDYIPPMVKDKVGERAYDRYLTFRRRLMKVTTDIYEGKRRIAYWKLDRGHPETLVFFHGFADSKDTFYDAALFLMNRYNLVCPDLPGFGKSEKRKDDTYDLENYKDWMIDFVKGIGLERFHLAGNSMGAAVAAEVAIHIPERITSLSLIDAAGIFVREKHSLYHEIFAGKILFEVNNPFEFEYFLDRIFYQRPLIPYPIKDYLYHEFHRHSQWYRKVLFDLMHGVKSDLDPKLEQIALNDRLQKISSPTLILWGDEDTLFPTETAYIMKNSIPNSRLYLFADTGHCPQIESPRQFAKVIKKFMAEEAKLYHRNRQ